MQFIANLNMWLP